ncbi:hypothetical protein C8R45DRAFT_928577 [Mycena sanguinolenta]|nr:hypothetical protein C8R45DRAFT_928577 [Mycena sanguinolenta]
MSKASVKELRQEIAKYMSLWKFWIALEIPPFPRYMFMHAAYEAVNYLSFFSPGWTKWIRRSTGCAWLDPNSSKSPALSKYSLSADAKTITAFIDSLKLEQYHRICTRHLRQYRRFDLSASTPVTLGVVSHCCRDLLEDSVEIAFLQSAEATWLGNWTISGEGTGEVMHDGWTRYFSIG